MKNLVFAKKINSTNETGIVDVQTKTVFCFCTEEAANTILSSIKKAKQYEDLEDKIAAFYPEDENEEVQGDLCDIGELAASHFGFM